MFRRIVVALDGSERGERAMGLAAEMAGRLGSPVHLVRVADVTWLRLGTTEAALEYAALGEEVAEEQAEARAYLDGLVERLRAGGVEATAEVRPGFAARELLKIAGPEDLLVMASHGRSGPARWLLGSVAEEVTRHARCPVMLVRASD